MRMTTRTIRVDLLTRVEGEGSLDLRIEKGKVTSVELRIFEPPRLFEGLLRGRAFSEAPDITSRICGICPIAYQMSSVQAIENAIGVVVDGPLRNLRRLIYCGEWIESHALHMVMLHAPDFLGYPDAVTMARDQGEMVKAGLSLKKAGNEIMRALGGREIHPINVKVGGFYRVPRKSELAPLADELKKAREVAVNVLRWVSGFPFPEFERDYEFVSLSHPLEYPINEGRIASSRGIDIAIQEFDAKFEERHVAHSTALQSIVRERGSYLVGPMARYNLNYERLPVDIRVLSGEVGLGAACRNPFKSILIRGIEVVYACDEALRLIEDYEMPDAPSIPLDPQAGVGHGATEAPRGICYHRYEIDDEAKIVSARIVPPTSQNQLCIEEDLRDIADQNISLQDDVLRDRCEQTIRNYDPCISCSAHFLKFSVNRA